MNVTDVSMGEAIVLGIWGILGVLTAIFIRQTIKKMRRAHFLTFGLVVAWLGVSAWTFRPFLRTFPEVYGFIPTLANGMLYPMAYYLIYLHYELIYRYRPHLNRLSAMSGLLGSALITSLLVLLLDDPPSLVGMLNDLSHDFIRLNTFCFATVVTFRTWNLTKEREPAFELTGLLFIVIGTFPAMLGNYTSIDELLGLSVYEWGDLMTFLGLVIILAVFIYNVDYLYRMPVPLYYFIVFNSVGITILSMPIKNRKFEVEPAMAQLISGPLTAITRLFEEIFKRNPEIEFIKAKNQSFLFESAKGLTAMIISERPTYFVKLSLRLFLKLIPNEIIHRLNKPYVKLDPESTMSHLHDAFHRAFPYVDVEEVA